MKRTHALVAPESAYTTPQRKDRPTQATTHYDSHYPPNMATSDSPSMPTISLNEPHELVDTEPVPHASLAEKKKRRQTAFYPKMNASNTPQKPFSRSAAKRESVMALGSIEHLQHYFTKTGLTAKKKWVISPLYCTVFALYIRC